MGLDITAYGHVKLHEDQSLDQEGCEESDLSLRKLWLNEHFPGRCDEFGDGAIVEYAEYHDGPSQPYGGYNRFREQLARIAGYPSKMIDENGVRSESHAHYVWDNVDSGPFFEQINFADNEGTLGPAVCAKLAKDYADFQSAADANTAVEGFSRTYAKWRAAFEFAAGHGVVVFH